MLFGISKKQAESQEKYGSSTDLNHVRRFAVMQNKTVQILQSKKNIVINKTKHTPAPISSSPTSPAHLATWWWINSCKLSNWCSAAAIYLGYPRTKVGGFLWWLPAWLNRNGIQPFPDKQFWCPNHQTKRKHHVHCWRRINITCKVKNPVIPFNGFFSSGT